MIAVSLVGCWSAEEKSANSAVENVSKTNAEQVNTTNQNVQSTESNSAKTENSAAETDKPLSPTATLLEFDKAVYSKSFERVRQVISKNTLEYFENEAKKQGMTFKELIERPSEMPTVETPETRNEKINGNEAIVEAKNRLTGSFDKYFLVKEDGVWKVDYEKYLKQKLEEINKTVRPVPKEK